MGSNGVLTSSDYRKQKNIESKEVKKPSLTPLVKVERKYCFNPAPMGKSQTIINFEGKPLKIELVDKVYSPPKNWEYNKLEKFRKVITEVYGFEDVSIITNSGKPKKDEKDKKYIYKVGHPDNGPDSRLEGVVSIKVGKETLKFECRNGIVETEDKNVFKAFLKKGWYEASVEEIE